MFTGLIKEIGTLESKATKRNGLVYKVKCLDVHKHIELGASIAVDGICQSVTEIGSNYFKAIAGSATFTKSTIKSWKVGRKLNLEPALSVGDSLDGHFVQGHIESVIRIIKIYQENLTTIIRLSKPPLIEIEECDSVAIDGISLTVSRVFSNSFEVNILPDTFSRTSLKYRKVTEMANFESDFLKPKNRSTIGSLNNSKLTKWGYV